MSRSVRTALAATVLLGVLTGCAEDPAPPCSCVEPTPTPTFTPAPTPATGDSSDR